MGIYDFEEELSDNDDLLQDEIRALSMACMPPSTPSPSDSSAHPSSTNNDKDFFDDDDDDLELVSSIKERYGFGVDASQPMSLTPLTTLPPIISDSDDEEDDFETLRAIQKRFSQYNAARGDCSNAMESNNGSSFVEKSLESECLDVHEDILGLDDTDTDAYADTVENVDSSSFPLAAQAFMEARKKNRYCQKFLRNKMLYIEARRDEINDQIKRLKTLRDFQVQCKKKIGRALSQKQDARVQLISAARERANAKKGLEKNVSAMLYGPLGNSQVALYKAAIEDFPLSFQQEKWSKNERWFLREAIVNYFQERLFCKSASVINFQEEHGFDNGVDGMVSSITNLDITPETIQGSLGEQDWNELASRLRKNRFPRRTGAGCEARWLNFESCLINRDNWTSNEDKHLLLLIQQNGICNWSYIAEKLGTNRTPFQCLARYQRSLNSSILKREWKEDEDAQLRSAVETFGEKNWQAVASVLEGRTGTQCANRWNKILLPARQRVGKWSIHEDKRLRVAVTLFGHKSWHRIAQFVPGRTQVQCRERWVNVLDPSLNQGKWTEEDDLRLKAAIAEHGYCWSTVAISIPLRTDNQCRRRWKRLFPDEVPLLKAANYIKKAALISNFVDRESERPTLGPEDFVPLPITDSTDQQENEKVSQERKSSRRGREADPTTKGARSRKRTKCDRSTECDNVRAKNALKQQKKSRLHLDQSIEWEDLPLAVVFRTSVSCIQRRIAS